MCVFVFVMTKKGKCASFRQMKWLRDELKADCDGESKAHSGRARTGVDDVYYQGDLKSISEVKVRTKAIVKFTG